MDMSFYVGALGAANCTEKLSVISNNLANVNNTGFKPKTTVFSELINYNLNDSPDAVTELQAGAGMRVERTYTGFDVAPVVQTESEYDYAIMQPNAFFMLRDPQTNEITYTRNGHFYRAEMEDGFYLMTESGKLVLDQNQEPLQLEVKDVEKMQAEMEEDYEEEVEEDDDEDDEDDDSPRISLYTFRNPSRLMSVGDNEYVPMDEGMEATLVEKPILASRALEASGTDVAKEYVRLIECQRAFSYALKMVQTSDEITNTLSLIHI